MLSDKIPLPVLALRDIVLFPGTSAPLFIGRKESLEALSAAKNIGSGEYILLTAQKKSDTEKPKDSDLYKVGTVGKIIQTVKLPNNNYKLIIEVEQRAKLSFKDSKKFHMADFTLMPDKPIDNLDDLDILVLDVISKFNDYVSINRKINPDVLSSIADQKNPSYMTNIVASHLSCEVAKKQK